MTNELTDQMRDKMSPSANAASTEAASRLFLDETFQGHNGDKTSLVALGKSDLLASDNNPNAITSLEQTVVAPAVNAALIEPWNAFTSAVKGVTKMCGSGDLVPHQSEMKVAPAEFLSLPWLVEGVSGGMGMLVPYLAAGKLTSGALRTVGAELNVKGAAANFLQNGATGQILGAALYDGLRDPKAGDTRIGNALGGAALFSTIYLGDAVKLPGVLPASTLPAATLLKRAVLGAGGATAQQLVSKGWSTGVLPQKDDLWKAAVSGAVMNMVLPESQKALGAVVDGTYKSFGIGVPIDRYLSSQLQDKPVAEFSPDLAQIQDEFPWARIFTGNHVFDFTAKDEASTTGGGAYSPERAADQLKGILSSAKPSIGLDVMMNTGLLPKLVPEMVPMAGPKGMQDPKWHTEGTAWEHTKMVVDQLAANGNSNDPTLMVTGLLHDIAKPQTQKIWPDGGISNKTHDAVGAPIAADISRRLGFTEAQADWVSNLVADHMVMHRVTKMNADELNAVLQKPQIHDLIELQNADSQGRGSTAATQREFLLNKLNELNAGKSTATKPSLPN